MSISRIRFAFFPLKGLKVSSFRALFSAIHERPINPAEKANEETEKTDAWR
jgi:hypothetical protein